MLSLTQDILAFLDPRHEVGTEEGDPDDERGLNEVVHRGQNDPRKIGQGYNDGCVKRGGYSTDRRVRERSTD
eukprot:scaffold14565_cov91-Cylindrotheca_fusiformis.AAC.4